MSGRTVDVSWPHGVAGRFLAQCGPSEDGAVDEPRKLLLTIREVAELLGLGERTIARMVERGEIPHVRIGRSLRFPRPKLEAWIDTKATH